MQLEQAAHDQQQQLREAEELQRQTEEDVDREILDLKNRYERQLRQRWEENTKLRGEVGILTKKVCYFLVRIQFFLMNILAYIVMLSVMVISKCVKLSHIPLYF